MDGYGVVWGWQLHGSPFLHWRVSRQARSKLGTSPWLARRQIWCRVTVLWHVSFGATAPEARAFNLTYIWNPLGSSCESQNLTRFCRVWGWKLAHHRLECSGGFPWFPQKLFVQLPSRSLWRPGASWVQARSASGRNESGLANLGRIGWIIGEALRCIHQPPLDCLPLGRSRLLWEAWWPR